MFVSWLCAIPHNFPRQLCRLTDCWPRFFKGYSFLMSAHRPLFNDACFGTELDFLGMFSSLPSRYLLYRLLAFFPPRCAVDRIAQPSSAALVFFFMEGFTLISLRTPRSSSLSPAPKAYSHAQEAFLPSFLQKRALRLQRLSLFRLRNDGATILRDPLFSPESRFDV